jgi:phosphatidylinositol glycan class B
MPCGTGSYSSANQHLNLDSIGLAFALYFTKSCTCLADKRAASLWVRTLATINLHFNIPMHNTHIAYVNRPNMAVPASAHLYLVLYGGACRPPFHNCSIVDTWDLTDNINSAGVLAVSALSDRWYYGFWTFPPYRFLHFNIAQNLAVFYGRNRWDYYVTEGLPLLLTTSLPFALYGMYRQIKPSSISSKNKATSNADPQIGKSLTLTVLFVTLCLSLISHKEVRFLYPLLPALNIIAAKPLSRFVHPRNSSKTALLAILMCVNIIIAFYTTQVHQRGVIDVTYFLRINYEQIRALSGPAATSSVAFLMPCHSTPWRSHLVHPSIEAWALTCNPPVDVPITERAGYLDEADIFYADPVGWLERTMVDDVSVDSSKRVWPNKLVFFEQLEPIVGKTLAQRGYMECWRGFNSHWHDDSRRRGDVIIWCK